MITELNNLVVEMAEQNTDLLELDFLINYNEFNKRFLRTYLKKSHQESLNNMINDFIAKDEHKAFI